MQSDDVRQLWGHDFRVVARGLAEEDVALFVEQLMRKYQASQEKSSHIEPLHQLARKSVEEAERIAGEIRARAEKDSQQDAAGVIARAEHDVQGIIERATKAADALQEDARTKVRERLSDIDESLSTMRGWAQDELHWMREHDERQKMFLSAFESFVGLMAEGVGLDDQGAREPTAPSEHRVGLGGAPFSANGVETGADASLDRGPAPNLRQH